MDVGWRFESTRSVLPEDALFGNTMFVGKMLMALDEAGGILSMRYCKGLVMTACVDAMDFYSPIFTHEVVTFKAGLNHVGTSSLEVGVKVLAEVPWTGEVFELVAARRFDVVAAAYGGGGAPLGTLGVIGPARMAYSHVIPLVEATARALSERLSAARGVPAAGAGGSGGKG